jgi:hypothetical protein
MPKPMVNISFPDVLFIVAKVYFEEALLFNTDQTLN